MTFPRQAKIFRGQLDPAPFVAVLLLLVIFLQISSLIHTPGVLVQLNNPAATINVQADGSIRFGTNTYRVAETNRLLEALKNSAAGPPFDLRVDRGTPGGVATQVSNVLSGLFEIDLPAGSTNLMIGTDHPTVMVAVNFLGQYFFENQTFVREEELTNQLRKSLEAAARNSRDSTLVVWADKRVDFNAVARLEQWAAEAGFKEVVQAQRVASAAANSSKAAR
ncbi:MAG: biopolymer transporter ExbD [Verrucomicrobiota bacterium]|jgi:biopolymer transport protein ExbD